VDGRVHEQVWVWAYREGKWGEGVLALGWQGSMPPCAHLSSTHRPTHALSHACTLPTCSPACLPGRLPAPGRKGRVVRSGKGGVFALRAKPDSREMDSLNIKEKQAFQDVRLGVWQGGICTGMGMGMGMDV
jgi:hypothetical protein